MDRALSSPVERLPPELTCHILGLMLPSDGETLAKNPPWYLGHVCQSWRVTALAYPPIWSHIAIPSPPATFVHTAEMLEAQHLRTASTPLHVYWEALPNALPNADLGRASEGRSVDPRVLKVVLPHSERWKSLHLKAGLYLRMSSWLRRTTGRVSGLETLEVADGYRIRDMVPDISIFAQFRCVAPSLRRVILTERYRDASPELGIPWGQVPRTLLVVSSVRNSGSGSPSSGVRRQFPPQPHHRSLDCGDQTRHPSTSSSSFDRTFGVSCVHHSTPP
ncbi:hypothetical protein K438DRAFT_967906 [Mycena galopus ATCC 62051]|nr:hypothetical protein K438DRAFT_967906 [Mycena galopus ATCC 62051]